MQLVKQIKGFFYNLALNKAIKGVENVQRQMINIDHAKNIGILFNATKPEEVLTISKFVDQLKTQERNVHILGYQNLGSKNEAGERFFNNETVSFFGIPKDEKIVEFQKLNLDILICAFKDECLPLEYVAATSKARFRVGAFNQSKTNYYELMINTGSDNNLPYLLQQVHHFLKVINKK